MSISLWVFDPVKVPEAFSCLKSRSSLKSRHLCLKRLSSGTPCKPLAFNWILTFTNFFLQDSWKKKISPLTTLLRSKIHLYSFLWRFNTVQVAVHFWTIPLTMDMGIFKHVSIFNSHCLIHECHDTFRYLDLCWLWMVLSMCECTAHK